MKKQLLFNDLKGISRKLVPFFLFLLTGFYSYSQISQTTITYAGSGLSTTATDVFQSSPSVGGYTHSTILAPYLYDTYNIANHPLFDGTTLYLEALNADVTGDDSHGDFTDLECNAYNIAYTFAPGNTYFVSVNALGHIIHNYYSPSYIPGSGVVGLGISIGAPQGTTAVSQTGANFYNLLDPLGQGNFLLQSGALTFPMYANYIFTPDNNATYTTSGFTVPSSTTGINIESFPSSLSYFSTLEINSVTVTSAPPITPTDNTLCASSETYSINTTWPVTWSARPLGLVTLSPSGNSVTLTRSGSNGLLTLTATVTDPNGNTFPITKSIQVGPVPTVLTGPYNSSNQIVAVAYTGQPYYFMATENPAVSPAPVYTWTLTPPPGSSSFPTLYTGSTVNLTFSETGYYNLAVAKTTTCGGSTTEMTVNVQDFLGFSTQNAVQTGGPGSGITEVSVFPNPATNSIEVNIPVEAVSNAAVIRVFDLNGKEVRKLTAVSQNNTINMTNLSSGTYIVEVYDGKKTTTKKIIKQ